MFAITAFGPFQGVEANPSDALARWLAASADSSGDGGGGGGGGGGDGGGGGGGAGGGGAGGGDERDDDAAIPAGCILHRGCRRPARLRLPGGVSASLLACDTLAVSARAADAWLTAALPGLRRACGTAPLVLLHLGVAPNASSLRLEGRAADEADFRCADADGWCAAGVAISAAALGLHAWGSSAGGGDEPSPSAPGPRWRATSIDVAGLAARLTAAGHDVRVSDDAGRFICNWIFYRSLEAGSGSSSGGGGGGSGGGGSSSSGGSGSSGGGADGGRAGGVASLFVHVPPFAAVPEQRQRAFLLDLLSALSVERGGGDV